MERAKENSFHLGRVFSGEILGTGAIHHSSTSSGLCSSTTSPDLPWPPSMAARAMPAHPVSLALLHLSSQYLSPSASHVFPSLLSVSPLNLWALQGWGLPSVQCCSQCRQQCLTSSRTPKRYVLNACVEWWAKLTVNPEIYRRNSYNLNKLKHNKKCIHLTQIKSRSTYTHKQSENKKLSFNKEWQLVKWVTMILLMHLL